MTAHFYDLAGVIADTEESEPELAPEPDTPELDAAESDTARPIAWVGVLAPEGVLTGDGRLIEAGALTWSDLPLPIRWAPEDQGEHKGAVVVGHINTITRLPTGEIAATGDFDGGSANGLEAARQVRERLTPGISVDLDDVTFEVRVAAELVEQGLMELADGSQIAGDTVPEEIVVPDADGRVTVARMSSADEVMATTSARIRAATLVAVPAFATAKIHLVNDQLPVELTAAGSYNPSQARVPKGQPGGGRWTRTPGSLGGSLASAVSSAGGPDLAISPSEERLDDLATRALAGGFTYDTGDDFFPTDGYAVARPGSSSILPATDDPEAIKDQLRNYYENVWDPSSGTDVIGGWYDTENGEICLDLVDIVEDRDEAIAKGQEQNQQAIFDLKNLEEIDTGGTGDERTYTARVLALARKSGWYGRGPSHGRFEPGGVLPPAAGLGSDDSGTAERTPGAGDPTAAEQPASPTGSAADVSQLATAWEFADLAALSLTPTEPPGPAVRAQTTALDYGSHWGFWPVSAQSEEGEEFVVPDSPPIFVPKDAPTEVLPYGHTPTGDDDFLAYMGSDPEHAPAGELEIEIENDLDGENGEE